MTDRIATLIPLTTFRFAILRARFCPQKKPAEEFGGRVDVWGLKEMARGKTKPAS